MIDLPRRAASVLVAGALASGLLAGCSTGSTESVTETTEPGTEAEAGAFPVTIDHAFGETTIESEPKRVVTVGYADQDAALALGVVPVGADKIVWGGNENDSTDWFDARLEELGGEQPTRYDESDGVPIDEIAKLRPDVVLASYSGITEQEYTKLSKLAPVVAYPDQPWSTSWQTSLETVGKALGRSEQAAEVKADVEQEIADTAEAHPELQDTSFVLGGITATDTSKIDYVTPIDVRPQVLTELGMENSPTVEELSKGSKSFYGSISAEKASTLQSDVFIAMFYDMAEASASVLTKDPLLRQIPGVENGGLMVADDPKAAQSLSTPTALSLPYAMEHFVPEVAKAAEAAQG